MCIAPTNFLLIELYNLDLGLNFKITNIVQIWPAYEATTVNNG